MCRSANDNRCASCGALSTDDEVACSAFLNRTFLVDRLLEAERRESCAESNSVTKEEWDEFASHRDYFETKGTALRWPYRQDSFAEPYWNIDGLKFWMLGPDASIASSDTRELHDGCLVFRADLGQRMCTFTGDASDANLNWIAHNTTRVCGRYSACEPSRKYERRRPRLHQGL